MLWKILSGLSAAVLVAAAIFSFMNKNELQEERTLKDRSAKNLAEIKKFQTLAAEAKTKRTKELEELTGQRDKVKGDVAKANGEIEEKQKENETLKKTLEEAQKQLAAVQDQIKKAGSIKSLLAEVEDLTKKVKDSEGAIANEEQQKALAEEKVKVFADEIKKLQEVDARQRRGQVEPGFTARVSQSYPGFGFVVLNKGNSTGMFANALLDVKRGKSVVARVKVREVEPNGAIADLVPGTVKDQVQTGDIVVPAKVPTNAEIKAGAKTTPGTPALPTAAPGAAAPGGAAPAAAPGGAPMAAPSMSADPFAAPAPGAAPAAPGAAPAAPAAPAPATPAPGAADPFAPAPAAGGAAPAPAAGGAAPAKPSTADPFAPK